MLKKVHSLFVAWISIPKTRKEGSMTELVLNQVDLVAFGALSQTLAGLCPAPALSHYAAHNVDGPIAVSKKLRKARKQVFP